MMSIGTSCRSLDVVFDISFCVRGRRPKGRRSRGDLLLFGLDCLASVEIVNGALRMGCCGKDRALVIQLWI
jgi:hypothetical protein